MNAETIGRALGGRKAGSNWIARCPAHDDREPSLSIRRAGDGKVLVRCHAGCDQRQVIAALRSRGLWSEHGSRRSRHSAAQTATTGQPNCEDAKRSAAALAIWQSAMPAQETLVATYLASRGLHLPSPPTLRFHARLRHPSGGVWPAMVALVTHGSDKRRSPSTEPFLPVTVPARRRSIPQKMMFGPCRGGAVRLGTPGGVLMVGEGIETCLAAMQATGNASLGCASTSGLRSLDLPGRCATWSCSPMATLPAKRRHVIVRGAGSEKAAASA